MARTGDGGPFARRDPEPMTTVSSTSSGSAAVQGDLWGARALDWGEVQEPVTRPLNDAVLRAVGAAAGRSLLDVGCGSGGCLARAEGDLAGIDAAEPFIAIARQRVPRADLRVGEMQDLPWPADRFDAVIGVNSFQYAADPVAALREARRVARPGARVAVATWGEPQDCEGDVYLKALGALMPPPPPGAGGPFALSAPGMLEALVAEAGLEPGERTDVDTTWRYPDLDTALRGLLAAGPAAVAIRYSGEEAVRAAVAEAIVPFATSEGGYVMENRFRFLVAHA